MFVSRIFSSVRYSLATINFLFLITGIVLFSVGVSAQVAYNDYHPFLVQRFFSLPAFLITTGVFIFLISVFGFFGAALQNYYFNMLYVGLMVVVFIFEFSACIAGYTLSSSATSLLQQQLIETMPLYSDSANLVVTALWDEVQRDFSCCGVTGPTDWPRYLPTHTNETNLPISCCNISNGAIGSFSCDVAAAHPDGCAHALGEWVSAHALGMGVAGLIICLIQLISALGAGWIARRGRFENIE